MLLHKETPPWYRSLLVNVLARIPLNRKYDGVESIIEFIGGLREDEQVSVEKLDRAAKLLSSAPARVDESV